MRLERAKRKVLELPFELPYAEPIGQRREQILRLARGLEAIVAFAPDQKPQRLRALGKLDEDHADVADHRQQHLAQILRLSVSILFRCSRAGDLRRADRTHARNAGDQLRDVGTEFCAKLVGVEAVEVRRAEQNGGAHRIGIELEAGDDGCRCQRAVEPGLAVGGAAVAVQLACIIGNCRDGRAICRRKSLSDLRVPRGQRFG